MKISSLFFLSHIFNTNFCALAVVPNFGGVLLNLRETVNLSRVLHFLKKNTFLQVKNLLDIWPIDYLGYCSKRFQLNYMALSYVFNLRLFVRVMLVEEQPVPTSVSVFPSAGWLERESWDMFGIFFLGNEDLRRILTDYGFEGFPLRKDFPLTGFGELRFDDECKRVLQQPVDLKQQFRLFEYVSTWE